MEIKKPRKATPKVSKEPVPIEPVLKTVARRLSKKTPPESPVLSHPNVVKAKAVHVTDQKAKITPEQKAPKIAKFPVKAFDEEAYKVGILFKAMFSSVYERYAHSAHIRVDVKSDGSYTVREE